MTGASAVDFNWFIKSSSKLNNTVTSETKEKRVNAMGCIRNFVRGRGSRVIADLVEEVRGR